MRVYVRGNLIPYSSTDIRFASWVLSTVLEHVLETDEEPQRVVLEVLSLVSKRDRLLLVRLPLGELLPSQAMVPLWMSESHAHLLSAIW